MIPENYSLLLVDFIDSKLLIGNLFLHHMLKTENPSITFQEVVFVGSPSVFFLMIYYYFLEFVPGVPLEA